MLRLAARRSTPAAAVAGARRGLLTTVGGSSALNPLLRRGPLPLPALQQLLVLHRPPQLQQQQRALSSSGGPGAQAWVSPDAVPKGENLKKYSRNLTKEAMDGKLDPVRACVRAFFWCVNLQIMGKEKVRTDLSCFQS